MSLLAPLYFLIGALAIGLPVLFHLIRRRPKGEIEFSSLMFVQPTPPRLTKRSRLENWPLLLVRALALLLLALAFARPFLRSVMLSDGDLAGRRVVMLIDTSASMQRTGLWEQATEKALALIDELEPKDELSIVSFDRQPEMLLSFEQSSELTFDQMKATAQNVINDAAATWFATDTGRALSYAAELAVTYEPDDAATKNEVDTTTSNAASQVVLISDMQVGSNVQSLQAYAWPDDLKLDIRRVKPAQTTNAAAQIMGDEMSRQGSGDKTAKVRIRVRNAADSESSRFRIGWDVAANTETDRDSPASTDHHEMSAQVPPGETRVLRLPPPPAGVTSLILRDDEHSFDNRQYFVRPQAEQLSLLYVGKPQQAERESLLFYLQRIPLDNLRRQVTVDSIEPEKLTTVPDAKTTPLIVLGQSVSTDVAQRLKDYVDGGGRLLCVLGESTDVEMKSSIESISGASGIEIDEADVSEYAMLSQIQFSHPLFEPMADPKYNDFTKVRFWSHRKITGLPESWRVLAEFDGGAPALIEHAFGDGRMWVLAAGWQPKASQLARSTKFLPLIYSFFGTLGGQADAYVSVALGDPIALEPSPTAIITGPSQMQFRFDSAADLDQLDRPGVYTFVDGQHKQTFVMNLAESESETVALDEEVFETFGIQVGKAIPAAVAEANQRQLRDVELEKSQKLWQWLLVAALVLLAVETVWGGLISRPRVEATAT